MKFDFSEHKNKLSESDAEAFNDLYDSLDEIDVPEPSERMRMDFNQRLEDYKLKNSGSARFRFRLPSLNDLFGHGLPVFKPAFAVIIFLLGIIAGLVFNNDHKETSRLMTELQNTQKTLMLTMLEQPSATERLKAVNLTDQIDAPDQVVINSLFVTLNNDENANVRLAALDALFRYSSQPEVRQGLIEAIAHQDSPMVLVTLSKAMVILQEKGSVEELRKQISKENFDENVRSRINENIQKII